MKVSDSARRLSILNYEGSQDHTKTTNVSRIRSILPSDDATKTHSHPACRASSPTGETPSLRNCDFFLGFFLEGSRRWCIVLRMARAAVLVKEVIDPGARALERPVRRRNVDFQQIQFIRRLRAIVDLDPDTSLFRNH